MSDLPERITVQRYYWDGERFQGNVLAYDAEKGASGPVYRREKTCEWELIPEGDFWFEGVDMIRSLHHRPGVMEMKDVVKYCPVCGGKIIIKDLTERSER